MAEARTRIVALGALWAITSGAVVLGSGCYTHNCDGDIKNYGTAVNEGSLLDTDTWQSNPVDGDWLPFPRQRLYTFDLHELGDRTPDIPMTWVSANKNPLAEGANFVPGGGNLTEISDPEKGKLVVKNGSCADYYLRVVVHSSPLPPASATADAGDSGP